jgi:hypothetical protein
MQGNKLRKERPCNGYHGLVGIYQDIGMAYPTDKEAFPRLGESKHRDLEM